MDFFKIIRLSFSKISLIAWAAVQMICISYFFANKIVERQIEANAETSLAAAEFALNAEISEFRAILFSAVANVQRQIRKKRTLEVVQEYLRDFHSTFQKAGEKFVRPYYVYGYIFNTFLSGTSWELPASFYAQRKPWLEAARNEPGEIVITHPYLDSRTGKFVISLAMRMSEAGEEYSNVLGMDVNLDDIVNTVASFQLKDGGYGFLLTPDLMFVNHFDKRYTGTFLADTGPEQAKMAKELLDGSGRMTSYTEGGAGKFDTIAFYKRTSNGWYVCVTLPKYVYYRDIHIMAFLLSATGLILIVLMSYFYIRLYVDKAKAEEENSTKTNFLAKMSHEIRTPLNSIIGMAEILSRKINVKLEQSEINEYVAIIQKSGISLLAIINDILDFSKIDSGKLKLNNAQYSFSSLLNDVVNIATVQIVDNKPIEFFVHVDINIPENIIGDETRVRQILVNLLSNAIKYTNYGFIVLDIKLNEKQNSNIILSFTVRDTGIGISNEDQKNIFAEFKRVDSRLNQKTEGTGLGLAIVQNLCHLMKGDVIVKSEYGTGSEFTVTIQQAAGSFKNLASVRGAEQKRVLLYKSMNSRDRQHEFLRQAVEELGVPELKSADSLEEFISELRREIYDCAFISSRYALNCLKMMENWSGRTKVVIMTELGDVLNIHGLSSITMPVYCVPLANVLNGESSAKCGCCGADNGPEFSAPSATILVVDDVPTNLRVAKEIIAFYGINVETCTDGTDALGMVGGKHYDLIFMDHMMPKMNGLEATVRIRQMGRKDEYFRNVPIIALTANAIVGQKEIFLKHGFNDFLAKPIESKALDEILKKWIPMEKRLAAGASGGGAVKDAADDWPRDFPKATAAMFLEDFEIVAEYLDIETGIRNVGGSGAAYSSILSVFCNDCEKQINQLRGAVDDDDISEYANAIHALKGILNTIGAERLASAAVELEEAAVNGETGVLKERTPSFIDGLQSLIGVLRRSMSDAARQEGGAAGAGAAKIDASPLKLDVLKIALTALDIHVVNDLLAEYQTMKLSPAQRALADEIENLITEFEFEKAIEKIDDTIKGLP